MQNNEVQTNEVQNEVQNVTNIHHFLDILKAEGVSFRGYGFGPEPRYLQNPVEWKTTGNDFLVLASVNANDTKFEIVAEDLAPYDAAEYANAFFYSSSPDVLTKALAHVRSVMKG